MGAGKSRNLYSIKATSRIAETEYNMGRAKPTGNAKNILSKIPIMGRAKPTGNAKNIIIQDTKFCGLSVT